MSVIIPAYNVAAYVADALQSLQNQTFEDFEAIIVDDGSTDATAQIAQQFCKADSRFIVVKKSNGGLSSARNYGIRHSQGEYIALLDSDDVYKPKKLESHAGILDRDPPVGVVYSASKAMRDDGKSTFISISGKPIHRDPLVALMYKNFIGHGSNAVFRRTVFDDVGEFDETLRSSEDVDFWLRIAAMQRWKFHRLPVSLCCYRVRPSGLSFNVERMRECREQVLQTAYRRSPEKLAGVLPTAHAYLYRYLARLCLSAKKIDQAKYFINLAMEHDSSIFYRDFRSFITLISAYLSPVSSRVITQVLGGR